MLIIDVSIVNVALPTIEVDLHFNNSSLQWVASAYALTFGGFLLLGGRCADLLGRRRLFMAGLALFTLASLACGFATSSNFLIGARAVQGLGAAMIAPAALSILSTTFAEGNERNKALAVWGAVSGAGGAVGVLHGRRPDGVRRLGVGLLRECADRPGGDPARAAPAARRAAWRTPSARST